MWTLPRNKSASKIAVLVFIISSGFPAAAQDVPKIGAPASGGSQYYVTPAGTPKGDGSMSNPWDLQTALSQPPSVKPGDTIWLRNGTYGNGSAVFTSSLSGSEARPIVVRQYAGERATINGGLVVHGSYVWFWGFEIANLSVPSRITNKTGSFSNMLPFGVDVDAPGSKFINLAVHDTAQGFGFWAPALNAEIYGSLIYNNGWQATDRGHGHGIYSQNQTGTKTIRDNIIFQGFDLGIQVYGSEKAYIQNYFLDGNTIFNSGTLSRGGEHSYNLLFAGGHRPQNITVENTYTYHTPSDNNGLSAFDWPAPGEEALKLTAINNYWIGGSKAIQIYNWKGLKFTKNTVYALSSQTLMVGQLQPDTYTWDDNTYYGSSIFELDDRNQTFDTWKLITGLDKHSTYTPGRPTGLWTFVRPNLYESGRANITIYNWALRPSVAVDVSNVLKPGDRYEVRNAQDFFGSPVASGSYRGGTIPIPMAGLSVAQPIGLVPTPPKAVGPEFGAFVLLRK